ncbi:hypothetical protein SAMN04488691_1109 [Haloferax larsenii]|uniref:Uncharacterized protein n=2 Tax=Haloferax larsenii TaxID=302484 RepID=A0A1H7TQM8_HALLR|nr:hypothetical protein SAMN04488691_1109 [Haloferax larsenii]
MAAGGLGSSVMSTGLAAASDESQAGASDNVEVNELQGSELNKLLKQVKINQEAKKLIKEVKELGWKPNWNSTRAVRHIVKQESVAGSIDTVSIPFEKIKQSGYKQKPSKYHEEMYLQWMGNKTLDHRELFDEDPVGSTIIHLKDDPDSDIETNVLTGPVADELTRYVVKNGSVISNTQNIKGMTKGSQDSVSALSGGTCEINVDVYEADPSTPCLSTDCLTLSGASLSVTAVGCVLSGGIVCLIGAGVGLAGIVYCLGCEKLYSDVVNIDKSYFDGKDVSCEGFSTDNSRTALPVTRCEIADLPIEENINPGGC